MAKFQKGHAKKGGKVKGTPNKLTQQARTVKETVLVAFQKLQQDPKANLVEWGKKNPAAFYQVAAKLIPTEIQAKVEGDVTMRSLIIQKASEANKKDDSK